MDCVTKDFQDFAAMLAKNIVRVHNNCPPNFSLPRRYAELRSRSQNAIVQCLAFFKASQVVQKVPYLPFLFRNVTAAGMWRDEAV